MTRSYLKTHIDQAIGFYSLSLLKKVKFLTYLDLSMMYCFMHCSRVCKFLGQQTKEQFEILIQA